VAQEQEREGESVAVSFSQPIKPKWTIDKPERKKKGFKEKKRVNKEGQAKRLANLDKQVMREGESL